MAQLFHPAANTVARASIGFIAILAGFIGWLGYEAQGSPYVTRQGVVRDQPVPFSHEHHVRGLGLDCRYCHTSVENSSFAGIPPTETCMTCHSKVWTNANLLQPIRDSWQTNQPIGGYGGDRQDAAGWVRVHHLPDFVYFNHSIHVNKGVGCSTCHGRVDEMPLMYQHASLQMEWCLDCHRDPAKNLRPRDQIFNMGWEPPADQDIKGKELAELYHVAPVEHLQTCYVCHR
jgi:ferredoxin